MTAISEKYRVFAQELGYITPMNYGTACTKLKNLNPGKDITEMQKKSARVIDLLRVANDLVGQGYVPPGRLGKLLSDGKLADVMEKIVHDMKELERKCRV